MHGRRNEPRFKCEYCDETFEKAIRMRFHVKNIHIDKIHKCSHCQKQFTKVDSLRSHIRYHHDRKYKICTCEICGKECMRPEILRVSDATSTTSQQKPFINELLLEIGTHDGTHRCGCIQMQILFADIQISCHCVQSSEENASELHSICNCHSICESTHFEI